MPDARLVHQDPPDDLSPDQRFKGVRVEAHLEWTVSSPYDVGVDPALVERHLDLWNTLSEEVESLQGFGPWYSPKHRMLGHPQLIQSPGVGDGRELLLQIDSDCVESDKGYPGTGMMWGDAGRVYFFMSDTDLKAANFDGASGLLETS